MTETINIPVWVAESTKLTWNEKALYSVYHYFTFIAQNHVCKLTNETLSHRLGMCLGTLRDTKRRLVKNGYIKTNGGISVTALVQSGETAVAPCEGVGIQQAGCRNPTGEVSKSNKEDVETQHHNKESKEDNKENKETYSISTCKEETEIWDASSLSYANITTEDLEVFISDSAKCEDVIARAMYVGEENKTVFGLLLCGYRWEDIDALPLLTYFKDNPTDEVYKGLEWALKDDRDVCLSSFCRNIGYTPRERE